MVLQVLIQKKRPERLLTIRRGHSIENKVHWVRDVVFREMLSDVVPFHK